MIAVLKDWREVGEYINALELDGLPLHSTPQKNWDHAVIRKILSPMDRDVPIIDLGCGRGYTLKFLRALGFTNLWGIDLALDWALLAHETRVMVRERRLSPPYHLKRGSICAWRSASTHKIPMPAIRWPPSATSWDQPTRRANIGWSICAWNPQAPVQTMPATA